MVKIRTGLRGGKYYIKNGNKVYVKSKKRSVRKKSKRTSRRVKKCSPGNKKFAKVVNGKCVRFGDKNMTIKKSNPARKRSFCARHRCKKKCDRATPGYQSCKKWNCATCKK